MGIEDLTWWELGDERQRNERLGAGVPRDMFLKPRPFDYNNPPVYHLHLYPLKSK